MKKVWTYILNKALPESDLARIDDLGKTFVQSWTAHENQLSGSFEIYKKRILIFRVDEEINSASGCSIDKLLRFIKQIEGEFKVELLNRLLVAYKEGEEIRVVHASAIRDLLKEKSINENTPVLNTAVATESEFKAWEKPLKETWLSKYLVSV